MGASPSKGHKISRHEKDLIKKSWESLMHEHEEDFAIELFLRIFKEIDGTLDMFERLRGMPLSAIKDHYKMKAHCVRVTAIITTAIEQLDHDQSIVFEMFRNIARTHYRLGNKIGSEHYEKFGKILLDLLEEKLGRQFDATTRAAWQHGFEGVKVTLLVCKNELES